jgi:glycosyltransferase involved in cell wall biosynthesis
LRVLLLSPDDRADVHCGDTSYTADLLAAGPGMGVEYTSYIDAVASGTLRELDRRRALRTQPGVAIRSILTNKLRSTGLAFREPIRAFAVESRAFDVIHVHAMNVRLECGNLPLVASNAATLMRLYRDAFGWGPRRLEVATQLERFFAKSATLHLSLDVRAADIFMPFSRHLTGEVIHADRFEVIPPWIAGGGRTPVPRTPRVGMIANDFLAKGGHEAVELTRAVGIGLDVVGCAPPPRLANATHVSFVGRVPRAHLLDKILPGWSALIHLTRADGYPLVTLEAMSRSVPVLGSRYWALPEQIGTAGCCPPASDRAVALQAMLAANQAYRDAAFERWRTEFAPDVVQRRLRNAYSTAVERHP